MKGHVYLIGTLDGCHKIGRSNDPRRRLAAFSPIMPVELRIVHNVVTADMGWLESYLHIAFAHRRTRGEWFRLDESEIGLIMSIPAADGRADLPPAVIALYEQNRPVKLEAARNQRDWESLNLSLTPAVVARLRTFCTKRGYLLRPVVEYALVQLLDNPPREIPQTERRGRPRKEPTK